MCKGPVVGMYGKHEELKKASLAGRSTESRQGRQGLDSTEVFAYLKCLGLSTKGNEKPLKLQAKHGGT